MVYGYLANTYHICYINNLEMSEVVVKSMRTVNRSRSLEYVYLFIVVVIFLIAALSKMYYVGSSNIIVKDPVFGVNNHFVLLAGAFVETVLVTYIVVSGNNIRSIIFTIFICYVFAAYRGILIINGAFECNCFSGMLGYAGISKNIESIGTLVILAFFLAFGTFLLTYNREKHNIA